jgi:hypothetical protein
LFHQFQAQNLYTSWIERGPKGTVHEVSKNGWFNMFLFDKWFVDLSLPILKRLPGKKVIVGDNLASHISPKAMIVTQKLRKEKNEYRYRYNY